DRVSLLPLPPAVAIRKLAWLNTLNPCASNFKFTRSVNLKTLARVMSAAHAPGPTKVLRPRFPAQPRQGVEKTGSPEAKGLPAMSNQPVFQRLRPGLKLDSVEDRKSTRLNSSHVAISYAVF